MLKGLSQGWERAGFTCLILPAMVCVLWLFLYWDAILSAVRIWYVSEIFQHGFFILPGALYLIWKERETPGQTDIKANYWVLPIILAFVALGVLGSVGGIQVFSHIAVFSVLPLAIWMSIGNAAARVIWFPLCFILFSIPIGEQLVPYLQKITADLAVVMLNWTSIPTYNTGLYIQIPQGQFVVAEACSGIRFFVGSLVFGAVYSHLSFKAFSRKLLFMLLALTVPVIANAVRVFGIVVIGYFSDMKYAAGADHIIYGWVFFSIVLVLLVLVGETFREKGEAGESASSPTKHDASAAGLQPALITLFIVFALGLAWQWSVTPRGDASESRISSERFAEWREVSSAQQAWQPVLKGQTDEYRGKLYSSDVRGGSIDLVLAWYAQNREGSELISSGNAFYDKEYWSQKGAWQEAVEIANQQVNVKVLDVVASSGAQRLVLYVYLLSDKTFTSGIKTKLQQSMELMFGGDGAGGVLMLSAPYGASGRDELKSKLLATFSQEYQNIKGSLPF